MVFRKVGALTIFDLVTHIFRGVVATFDSIPITPDGTITGWTFIVAIVFFTILVEAYYKR